MISKLGVILAGGRSKRMGSDKAMLTTAQGISFLQQAIDHLSLCCDEVVVVGDPERYEGCGIDVIKDVYPNYGPLGAIYSVMLVREAEHYFVRPVDTPFCGPIIYKMLFEQTDSKRVIIAEDREGQRCYLNSIWPRSVFPLVEQRVKEHLLRVRDAVAAMPHEFIVPERSAMNEHPTPLKNINTEEEYQRFV